MSAPVYDLSDFDDDVDMSMFEDSSNSLKGSVYWPGIPDSKLFDYEVLDDQVNVNLTPKGQALYRTEEAEIHDVDNMVFAQFLGLQAENAKDLERRIENSTGLPFISSEAIIDAAKKENRLEIRSEDEITTAHLIKPTSAQIVSIDLSDLEQKCKVNTIRYGARNVASVYRNENGTIKPYMVKYPPSDAGLEARREENRMMAFEHAALEGLKRHGVQTVSSEIHKGRSGANYLVTERFDGRSFDKDGSITKNEMYSPISWMQTVKKAQFEPLSASEAPRAMFELTKSHPLSEDVLTRHIFNKLIGNADAHGFNVGLISRMEGGTVKRRIAPAFDVTPYLMGQSSSEAAEDFGLKGKILSNLSLQDLASSDSLINEMCYKSPEMAKKAYDRAIDARSTMMSIIEDELARDGLLEKSDVDAFKSYMTQPLGGLNNENSIENSMSSSGIFGFDGASRDAFKQRALNKDLSFDQTPNLSH